MIVKPGEWTKAIKPYRILRQTISREEQESVFAKVRAGDRKTMDRVVRSNVLLVVKVAKKYQGCGVAPEDLISAGVQGLHNAALRFSPSMGTKFISYAVWYVRQAIAAEVAETARTIRRPLNVVLLTNKTRREINHGKEVSPKDREILEHCDRLDGMLRLGGNDDDDRPYDVEGEDDVEAGLIERMKVAAVRRAIAQCEKLSERDRDMIIDRFGLEGGPLQTLNEVGSKFGVSREAMRQAQAIALRKLKQSKKTMNSLRDYYLA